MDDVPTPPDDRLPTVSVVIPTYRRAGALEATLRPLLADPATTELIVAVDGDDDGSGAIVTGLAETDTRVRLLTPPHGGQRHALTVGVAAASGDVVLLLDDDVVAHPGLVTGHAGHHRAAERLVVAGYMPCAPSPQGTGVPVLSRIYDAAYESHCAAVEEDPSRLLRQLWGGNVSLRRLDCEAVGFPPWPYAHDDRDFGLRCLRAGLRGTFDRRLRAEHRHDRSARQFLANSRSFGAGLVLLHRVHGDLIGPLDDDALGHVYPVLRPAVDWVATPERSHLVTSPLVGLARLAGHVRATAVESAGYRLARRVELRVGAGVVEGTGTGAGPG